MSNFQYDVYFSHKKDKSIVRPFAERLRNDRLNVRFYEWEIKPSGNIPAKIEEGLECSHMRALCMSANAFGSDWTQLESGTFHFCDPLNQECHFVPPWIDDSHGSPTRPRPRSVGGNHEH